MSALSEEQRRHLRKSLLVEAHGTLEKQKDELIEEILSACQTPEHWPLTDAERIEFIRTIYRRALNIQTLAQA